MKVGSEAGPPSDMLQTTIEKPEHDDTVMARAQPPPIAPEDDESSSDIGDIDIVDSIVSDQEEEPIVESIVDELKGEKPIIEKKKSEPEVVEVKSSISSNLDPDLDIIESVKSDSDKPTKRS